MPGTPRKESAVVESLTDDLDASYQESLKTLARAELGDNIETLKDLRDNAESEPVRRGAANDLIDHGIDRAAGKKGEMERALRGGIQVNVIQFGDGQVVPEVVVATREMRRKLKSKGPDLDPEDAG